MSGTKRYKTVRDFPVGRDAEGRPLCRWCKGAVKPPRRTMCSNACAHEVELRTNLNYLRSQVFKRDRGVCAACGGDTQKFGRVMDYARKSLAALTGQDPTWANGYWFVRAARETLEKVPWEYGRANWEADHILEVVRGGDSGLENMQTLCVPCHKQKTKRLAQERARERRGQLETLFA